MRYIESIHGDILEYIHCDYTKVIVLKNLYIKTNKIVT